MTTARHYVYLEYQRKPSASMVENIPRAFEVKHGCRADDGNARLSYQAFTFLLFGGDLMPEITERLYLKGCGNRKKLPAAHRENGKKALGKTGTN